MSQHRITRRIREAREAKGLSQAQLAKRAGMVPSAISHFETGSRLPSLQSLDKLAAALLLSPGELLGDPKAAAAPLEDPFCSRCGRPW